jgi:tetratricopeptide (TPR) repeat protein
MLTIKKQFGKNLFLFPLLAVLLAGCTPPGPRALLDGVRLIDEGNYPAAIEKLKLATSLLNTNASAWNYLGIACQHAGKFAEAEQAYGKARAANRDLVETHYNLGCLWLEQNRPDLAKTEFLSFTSLRPGAVEGWLKLGAAQLRSARGEPRSREWNAAADSFNQALHLSPQNAEALNGLGIIQHQRSRPGEAAQFFEAALKQKPDYAPALLNLAIVSQPGNRSLALQKYREYLALSPRPADWQAVEAVANELSRALNGSPRPPMVPVTNAPPPIRTNPAAVRIPANASTQPANPARPTPVTNAPATPVPAPPPANVQVVQLPPEPVVRPAREVSPANTSATPHRPSTNAPPPGAAATAQPEQRSFLQKINPLNLFRRDTTTNTPPESVRSAPNQATSADGTPTEYARYQYHSIEKPEAGDHISAERIFTQGVQAQQANHLPEAMRAYQQAAQLDPAYYEPQYYLGVASAVSGNLPRALLAYETALAIRPESLDARIYFAQTLKQANYPIDAAIELEKVLASYPNDARAHLTLGNLYAQQLRNPVKAREHYLKVLDKDPRNPRAAEIRFWLASNPP